MPESQERVLTRTYSLLAAASVVPLLIVILLLTWFQFSAQRGQLLAELEEQAVGHNILLSSIVKTVQDQVRTLGAWGEIYWSERDQARLPPLASGGAAVVANGALQVQGRALAGRADGAAEARLAQHLARHMRLSHQEMPYLRWSYYLSARRDLLSVVPFAEGQSFGGALRDAPPEAILAAFADHPIAALLTRAPARAHGERWSAPYEDPGGAGWAVAFASPLSAPGRPLGVVGGVVMVDFLTGFLRAFDYPAGRLWLVDDQLQVLAASEGDNIEALGLVGLHELLPEPLRGREPAQLLVPSRAFRDVGGAHALAQRVGTTPWTLLYVVLPDELNGVVLPRLGPYAIILACLILTLLLAHAFRQRVIVRPALAFADYIKAESKGQPAAPPRLPAFWQPLVGAAGEAFEAQRSALARIQDSEAMKSAIIASAFDAVVAIDAAGLVVEFNPSAERMFGITREAALGRSLADLIVPPQLRERHRQGLERYLEQGRPVILGRSVEMEAQREDGSLFPVEVAITEVRQAGRQLFTAYLRDITGRRAMERAIRESEQHFRTVAESHPVPVAIVNLEDGRILHASQAFAELFRMPLEKLAGFNVAGFYADPGQRAELLEELRRHGAVRGYALDQRRPDGSVFPTALTSRLIEFQGAPAVISAVVDLTEQQRQEAEIARQREALHQSEKLNALGSLLASVAHELNNPLSVVVGYATMLRDQAPDGTTHERAVKVQAAAERCARIVRSFLAMARRKPEAFASVQLNQVVEGALEVAGYGLRTTDVEVTLELDPDLPPVDGDADQLTLVLMNLVVNAQHALQGQAPPRRLEITTRRLDAARADRDRRQRARHPDGDRRSASSSRSSRPSRRASAPASACRCARASSRRTAARSRPPRGRAAARCSRSACRPAPGAGRRPARRPSRARCADTSWWSRTRSRSRRWWPRCSAATATRSCSPAAAARRSAGSMARPST